ncbi:MAG: methionine--tRNA ligase [Proteobacteria bacterium]|nr:methionine--tRNA ligase [Pseudomonadota bacterium]
MTRRPFYITTAIDYVNGEPHLGHAYEKITTDVIARWRRFCGDEVRFLTGTDEHGIKVQKTAADHGLDPQTYVDGLVPKFKSAWEALDIEYDRFIRTTDPDHEKSVLELLRRIRDNGYLFEKTYNGWYCEGCEGFKTEKDLPGGKCPEHPTREPKWLEEENLFFKLSAFTQPLLDHIAAKPSFIEPASRRNEVLKVLEGGLDDISISRSKGAVSWGIDIDFRPDSVIYVWFDALINYLTGAGFGTDDALYERFWPTAVHIIGKDITRFHCIIWPAMLLAAGIPVYDRVFAHGWVTTGGAKLSKSAGGGGASADPGYLAATYGPDAVRWFLTSQVTYGRDGEFSLEQFENIYDAHLANGLGNLVSRSVGMAKKYFGGVPDPAGLAPDELLSTACATAVSECTAAYDGYALHDGAAAAWKLVTLCNEQIQLREPWKMAKDEARADELKAFLYGILETLRIACVLLAPVLPGKTAAALAIIGAEGAVEQGLEAATAWGGLPVGIELERPAPLFPRLDQIERD